MKNMQPLLFEIGQYSAVDLSADPSGKTVHPGKHYIMDSSKWHQSYMIMAIITFMTLCALIVLHFTSPKINAYARWSGNLVVTTATIVLASLIVAGICVAVAGTIFGISHQPGEEPFSLFEGISIWPAQLFRLAASLLACLFFYWSWRDHNENKKSIESKLFNGNVGTSFAARPALDQIDWPLSDIPAKSTLKNLWSDYMRRAVAAPGFRPAFPGDTGVGFAPESFGAPVPAPAERRAVRHQKRGHPHDAGKARDAGHAWRWSWWAVPAAMVSAVLWVLFGPAAQIRAGCLHQLQRHTSCRQPPASVSTRPGRPRTPRFRVQAPCSTWPEMCAPSWVASRLSPRWPTPPSTPSTFWPMAPGCWSTVARMSARSWSRPPRTSLSTPRSKARAGW